MTSEQTVHKYRPIPFNAEMVRAILDGRKTQTRRPMKINHPINAEFIGVKYVKGWAKTRNRPGWFAGYKDPLLDCEDWSTRINSPFGKQGDRLWVRESATCVGWRSDGTWQFRYEADRARTEYIPYPSRLKPIELGKKCPNGCYRELSRITLEVVRVWVERVQDISEEDAIAEGIEKIGDIQDTGEGTVEPIWRDYDIAPEDNDGCCYYMNPCHSFQSLFEQIYGAPEWNKNPWVWCCEFKRVDGEGE